MESNNYLIKDCSMFSIENSCGMVGISSKMQEIRELIGQLSGYNNAKVLILGENGTGKELVARALHCTGSRKNGPFVPVNCRALTETLLENELFGQEKGAFTGAASMKKGRFELADGGTLFLDEIGELSQALQVKLLRVLEDNVFERVGGVNPISVNIRVIAATNKKLKEEVEKGRFRQDLFYRLHVTEIVVPPLRERIEDIPLLVDHFVKEFCAKEKKNIPEVQKSFMNGFMNFKWPGNIRELENVIERAIVLAKSNTLTDDNLSPDLKNEKQKIYDEKNKLNKIRVVFVDDEKNQRTAFNKFIITYAKSNLRFSKMVDWNHVILLEDPFELAHAITKNPDAFMNYIVISDIFMPDHEGKKSEKGVMEIYNAVKHIHESIPNQKHNLKLIVTSNKDAREIFKEITSEQSRIMKPWALCIQKSDKMPHNEEHKNVLDHSLWVGCISEALLNVRKDSWVRSWVKGLMGSDFLSEEIKKHILALSNCRLILLIGEHSELEKRFIAEAIHEQSERKDHAFEIFELDQFNIPAYEIDKDFYGYNADADSEVDVSKRKMKRGPFERTIKGTVYIENFCGCNLSHGASLVQSILYSPFRRINKIELSESGEPIVEYGGNKFDFKGSVILGVNSAKDLEWLTEFMSRVGNNIIEIQPLSSRKNDIPKLAKFFFEKAQGNSQKKRGHLSQKVVEALQNYNWQRNTDELYSVMEHIIIHSPDDPNKEITSQYLPPYFLKQKQFSSWKDIPREQIEEIFRKVNWKKSTAAKEVSKMIGGQYSDSSSKLGDNLIKHFALEREEDFIKHSRGNRGPQQTNR